MPGKRCAGVALGWKVVPAFPGGDDDGLPLMLTQNVIDFDGGPAYVRARRRSR